jgi:hypothetical protein
VFDSFPAVRRRGGGHAWNQLLDLTLDQAAFRGIDRRTSTSFRHIAKPFIG